MKHQQVKISYQPILYLPCFFNCIVGGCAHLTSFYGTDTISGCVLAKNYYLAEKIAAHSIPASEHSTIVSWTRDRERDAYENLLSRNEF
jgi:nicotinamide phosphoribosyltransferase